MSKQLLFYFLFVPLFGMTQNTAKYPREVEAVLKKSGKNRGELEKAIKWCKKTGDPLKVKAIYFLIENMDIHFSADYYFSDKIGNKIPFNEFNYPSNDLAQQALLKISKSPGNRIVAIKVNDIENIKGAFLINNITNAFAAWKSGWAANIPFADFCEYILPYRVSVEPLQDWRESYGKKYRWFQDTLKQKGSRIALYGLATNNKTWFHTTYGIEERKEPLPRLGAMQLLFRKKGPCEDIADLQVFALRSQGIPASLNIIPYWATSTGSHFVNTVFDPTMKAIQYDASRPNPLLNKMLNSEPSKVIRMTFAKQPGTLASIQGKNSIPDGFMRAVNYIDITNQYWETTDFKCSLYDAISNEKIVYACVYNGLIWKPTW